MIELVVVGGAPSLTFIVWHRLRADARGSYTYLHKRGGPRTPQAVSALALTAICFLTLALEGTTLALAVTDGGALVAVSEGMSVAVGVAVSGGIHCHWSLKWFELPL